MSARHPLIVQLPAKCTADEAARLIDACTAELKRDNDAALTAREVMDIAGGRMQDPHFDAMTADYAAYNDYCHAFNERAGMCPAITFADWKLIGRPQS